MVPEVLKVPGHLSECRFAERYSAEVFVLPNAIWPNAVGRKINDELT